MPANNASQYKLEGFLEWMEIWEKNEPISAVSDQRRIAVLDWIMSRYSDPYAGARREPVAENYWFAKIPWTLHDGQVVVCNFWIYEAERRVVCDQIGTLGWPV
ncbi:hypothetical protein [Nonomuraea bangladeshensis]|uniref:hypothetical protein n=1 Tax=Nonomuraea bangladeshensis TaxID=404385 RepID=UPI003C2B9798